MHVRRRLLHLQALTALCLALAGCGHHPPATPEALPSLDRAGLDSLAGHQWSGDHTPVANVRRELAWLIQNGDTAPVFGVEILVQGSRRLAVLSREVGRSGPNPVWQILDAGRLPALSGSARVVSRCRRGQAEEQELFAIANAGTGEELTDIRAAWRANTAAGHFEPVGKDAVRCANAGGQ